jgi:hypothetical protein
MEVEAVDLDTAIARLEEIVAFMNDVLAAHHGEIDGEVPPEFDIFCQRSSDGEYGYCDLEDAVESLVSVLDMLRDLRWRQQ